MASQDETGLYAPGSFNYKKVYLKDYDLDIRFKTLEINIFESIFQPCMTADLTLIDSENMVANFPIVEGNIVELELECNDKDHIQQSVDGEGIKCTMEIIKITARAKSSNQDLQTYTLRLASAGWGNNIRDRVSRAYTKKAYSSMVEDIFNDKFSNKSVNGLKGNLEVKKKLLAEKTYGEYSVIIPRWKPIVCFNWLAGRSQSNSNKNAVNYMFWEDKDNYNFASMESMMKKEIRDTYYVKIQNVKKDDPANYFNIYSYTYEDTGDILLYANNGTLGSRLITHDIVSKQVVDYTPQGFYSLDYNVSETAFDYYEEFSKIKHTDKVPLVEKDISETLSREPGNTRLFVHGKHNYSFDGVKDDKCEEWLRQRIMQKPMLKYIRMNIQTLGNFRRKAGEMIKIELPSPEEEKGLQDKKLKGNYLVTTVRRIFKPSRHDCIMECIKDSYAS